MDTIFLFRDRISFLNGYSDWRLPTKEELNAIYVNLVKHGTRRQSFNIDGIYWSSTEYSSGLAWGQREAMFTDDLRFLIDNDIPILGSEEGSVNILNNW